MYTKLTEWDTDGLFSTLVLHVQILARSWTPWLVCLIRNCGHLVRHEFKPHQVDNIHKKPNNKVLLLRRIKPYITLEMRKLYYNSYILPIIDYGIILWQYAPKRKLIKIANIQKQTAYMILDKSWDHPSNPLFK